LWPGFTSRSGLRCIFCFDNRGQNDALLDAIASLEHRAQMERSRKDAALHVLTAIAVLALLSYLIFGPSI
jgi:hypothetical protein